MERSVRRGRVRSRRRTGTVHAAQNDKKTQIRATKLTICVVIFILAVFTRLVFPGFFASVGERIGASVDYRTALSILGEGISGERPFISAVGDAFTHAFRIATEDGAEPSETDIDETDGAVERYDFAPSVSLYTEESEEILQSDVAKTAVRTFMQSQEEFSYFTLPAGTTFETPPLNMMHTTPVMGVVASGFGLLPDATHGVVFNHGVTIGTKEGAPIMAFADGEVIAVGENAVLGKFIIIAHDGAETRYGHLGEVLTATGQTVLMGDVIARAGSTGRVDEPTLRFELRIGGIAVNPEFYTAWE